MDLKFSFGGASPDHHDHGDAPSGIPLPFAGTASLPVSNSNELDVVVRIDRSATEPLVVAEVITGDGVTYSRGDVLLPEGADQGGADQAGADRDFAALAKAVRSAVSRAVAGLEGPLAQSITAIELQLASVGAGADTVDAGAGVIQALDLSADDPQVSEALQARIGVSAGTKIRVV